ncbi:hypothetical protein [Luteimonas changyuni]|uniref:hypothetical protein n=1 Tax=Luteimonas sp. MJ145 TaxID=3129234 RepID=UPI0031BB9213
MNNAFDDNLPTRLKIPEREGNSVVDVRAVADELARALGWYRKETAERITPKGRREQADRLSTLLQELAGYFEQPTAIDPLLRSRMLDNMRHLRIAIPEFSRIAGCVVNAARELPEVRTGPSVDAARGAAARMVYQAIRAHTTPQLGKVASRELAAKLLMGCQIRIPDGDKERRAIMGEG